MKGVISKGLAIILANPFLFSPLPIILMLKFYKFMPIYTCRRNDMLLYIILGMTLVYVAVIIYLYLKSERSV